MQDKIFLPVEGLKFNDLHDWDDPKQKCQTNSVIIQTPTLTRQQSGTGTLVHSNEKAIALFRYGASVFAVNEKCPHAGGPLHLGDLEELPDRTLCVRCPWHSWRYDVKSGNLAMPKGHKVRVEVYPVRIQDDGTLCIGFDGIDDKYFNTRDNF